MTVVAVAVVSGPIVGDVVVVADQDLPLLVGVFHLLGLIWLKGVLM